MNKIDKLMIVARPGYNMPKVIASGNARIIIYSNGNLNNIATMTNRNRTRTSVSGAKPVTLSVPISKSD
jgi:hypothetical protein